MRLETENVVIPAEGGGLPGYLTRPAAVGGPLPGVVVIQEIWGTDAHIEDVCDRLATAGYAALAPDLYAHGGKRHEALSPERVRGLKAFLDRNPRAWVDRSAREEGLSALAPEDRDSIGETFARMMAWPRPMEQYLSDLRSSVRFLLQGPSAGRAVGSIGFCMGGELSGNLATVEPDLAAAVIFYGPAPDDERLSGIACPLLGLYGADDARVTDGVPDFDQKLARLGKQFSHFIYRDSPHAFFNDTRPSYRPEAARDAWARVLSFFSGQLH